MNNTESVISGKIKKILILYAIFAPLFIIAFASTGIISLIKSMQVDLGLSDVETQWQVVMYTLFASATVPIAGQLGDVYGSARMFKLGVFICIISSILLSIGTNVTLLMIGQILRGMSAAFIFPHSLSVPALMFPPKKLKLILFIFGVSLPFGWILGPFFCGMFAMVDWRLLFWIKLLLLVPSIIILHFYKLKLRKIKEPKKPDIIGSILIFLTLISIILLLSEGPAWGWTSPQQIVLYSISPVLLLLFIYSQIKIKSPLISLPVCMNKVFLTGAILMSAAVSSSFGFFYFVNYYFLSPTGQNSSYFEAGAVLLPPIGAILFFSLISMKIAKKIGFKKTSCISCIIMFSGALILLWLPDNTSYINLWWRFVILGIGAGLAVVLGSPMSMSKIEDKDKGMSSGAFLLIVYFLASAFLPIAQIWYNHAQFHDMNNYLQSINLSQFEINKIIQSTSISIKEINTQLSSLGLSKEQINEVFLHLKSATNSGFGRFGLLTSIFAAIAFVFCLLFAPGAKIKIKKPKEIEKSSNQSYI
jgi:MFS family permease